MNLLQTALSRAAVGVDETVLRLAGAVAKRTIPTQTEEQWLRSLRSVAEHYNALPSDAYFPKPSAPSALRHDRVVRTLRDGGMVREVSFASGFLPSTRRLSSEFSSEHPTGTVHARWWKHSHAAPTILCLHGYRMGTFPLDEIAWDAASFYEAGFDVALMVLPMHGARAASEHRLVPKFPSSDLWLTNEAFLQSVWDARRLHAWLLSQGANSVGVAGVSLGGYLASVLATVEASWSFVLGYTPLADPLSLLQAHYGRNGEQLSPRIETALREALQVHSPLARTPVVASDRMMFLAGDSDRITHGEVHAARLQTHFGAKLSYFPGGHLFQFGRKQAVEQMIAFARENQRKQRTTSPTTSVSGAELSLRA